MAISSSWLTDPLIHCLPSVLIGQTSEGTFYCPALGYTWPRWPGLGPSDCSLDCVLVCVCGGEGGGEGTFSR